MQKLRLSMKSRRGDTVIQHDEQPGKANLDKSQRFALRFATAAQ